MGHIKYPFLLKDNLSETFLVNYYNVTPDYLAAEYLAWKYLSEVDSNLINYEFLVHFKNINLKIDVYNKKEGVRELARDYFKLKCFTSLITNGETQKESQKISNLLNNLFLGMGLSQDNINSFDNNINEFLNKYNPEMLDKLCRSYEDLKDELMRNKFKL